MKTTAQKNRKVIINMCLTGMIPTKELNPHTPITPEEIAQSALQCAEMGASIVHIHARDTDGRPTWKKEIYKDIIGRIKEKNDKLLICVTTSGRSWNEFERRSEVLDLEGDLKPDLASLTVGSMNFINQESVNTPQMIEQLANKMKEKGIKPELEVFDPGMIHKANYMISKGIIEDGAPYFNILLGSLGTSPFDSSCIATMHHLLPDNAIWSFAGIGAFQLDANVLALAHGGNFRVGLEDNIFFDREKKVLASNEMLLERMRNIMTSMALEPTTPDEAREILQIK